MIMLMTAQHPMAKIHEIDLVRERLKPFCRKVNSRAHPRRLRRDGLR
jgi:hypothetical protein